MVSAPRFDSVFIEPASGTVWQSIEEGKVVNGRFEDNIRIDQPTHGVGQTHAHIYGRKGNQIGVINIDGTPSHGSQPMRFHPKDVKALNARGWKLEESSIVYWTPVAFAGGRFLVER
jgi:hypothetical protein